MPPPCPGVAEGEAGQTQPDIPKGPVSFAALSCSDVLFLISGDWYS